MSDDLLTFVIDGSQERNGYIPGEAFVAKLGLFMATIYGFERAFSNKTKRQIDLEIVDLSRQSPAQVKFRTRSKVESYPTQDVMRWTMEQLGNIYDGKEIDKKLPQPVIDNVIQLSDLRKTALPELSLVKVTFGGKSVRFDETMKAKALAVRAKMEEQAKKVPWHSGVSYSSIFGELRGIMDFEGERQFFILPPSGADRVRCVFSEDMRNLMVHNLFKPVRVHGYLHYDGATPFPYLMEAQKLEGIEYNEEIIHFADLAGMFQGLDASDDSFAVFDMP